MCFTTVPIMAFAFFDWEFPKEEFVKKGNEILYKIGF
jgi:hypothetical protein